MIIVKTFIKDLLVFEPKVFEDDRGWFMETYSFNCLKEYGINISFVQDNHSFSRDKGILRGLHFQKNPFSQTKLFRCIRGMVQDVAVDLRKGSPTYKKWFSVELSSDNKKQLFIPKGFAHGFLTLSNDVEVEYKVDEFYNKESERSIRFDDDELKIEWAVKNPILSMKDKKAPFLRDSDIEFTL
ncbi:MAG: dTDP-4-dehydrorhamnose 3,5-epimerase [Oscillospiraceae bacterium]|nr:dTDP-4-dehydrorhamnose 3,5-epimerase [Oscillospiraceae bacterium]